MAILNQNNAWWLHSEILGVSGELKREHQNFMVPGLVNIQKAIENGHRNSGFTQL